MKTIKNKVLHLLGMTWIFILINSSNALAQCAMCRASVETNINEDGIGFVAKLNTGILYLFIMPYVLAMVIGYLWYKKSKEHRRMLEAAEYRKHKISHL